MKFSHIFSLLLLLKIFRQFFLTLYFLGVHGNNFIEFELRCLVLVISRSLLTLIFGDVSRILQTDSFTFIVNFFCTCDVESEFVLRYLKMCDVCTNGKL